ncbi:MAG: M20 family metallopeptidase [Lautropia sp.]
MTTTIDAVLGWLEAQREAMLGLTRELVDIDSGSRDKAGTDRVADRLGAFFADHGLSTGVEEDTTFGRATFTRTGAAAPAPDRKGILLIGHRDTVFPAGEAARRPFGIDGDRAYGPGVCDMKAGLAMQAFVLVAMHRHDAIELPLTMMTTSDEEISSPFSRPHLEREARQALAVLNAEPGRPNGGVVIARKGSVFFDLDVSGRAAHSGVNFFEGASAISALAHKVIELDALTDEGRGITMNVGTVVAGQSVNTVAAHARAQLDLRYIDPVHRDEIVSRVNAIAGKAHLEGTDARAVIAGEMVPMPERPSTLALFALYKEAARASGFDAHGVFTGGCSDSGFTSAAGAPTLCAVGPTGGKAHTPHEFMEVSTFLPRTHALARTVFALAAKGDAAFSQAR